MMLPSQKVDPGAQICVLQLPAIQSWLELAQSASGTLQPVPSALHATTRVLSQPCLPGSQMRGRHAASASSQISSLAQSSNNSDSTPLPTHKKTSPPLHSFCPGEQVADAQAPSEQAWPWAEQSVPPGSGPEPSGLQRVAVSAKH